MTVACGDNHYQPLLGGVKGTGSYQKYLRDCSFNVRLALVSTGLYSMVTALYASSGVLDSFLYMISNNSNSAVGFAESISGVTILVMALPAGYVVDHYSRARMIRIGSIFDWVVTSWYIYAVWSGDMHNLYIAMFLMGCFDTIFGSCSYSLLADSIPQGERSSWMTKMAIVGQASAAAGPAMNLVLFYFLGNEWDITHLKFVLTVALAMYIPLSIMNLFWRDIQAARDESESSPETVEEIRKADESVSKLREGCGWMVPYVVCSNNVATSIGAGMTVKFFPLFFRNDYGFSPADLQWLAAGFMVSFCVCTLLCQRAAKYMGRVEATLAFSLSGVACLFALAWVRWLPLVVFVYLVRGAVQNSVYPTDRSIIMDFVPSNQRGRWNAIESVASFSWSGSAALGGWLMDSHDYRYAFVITAYVYLAAWFLRLPLLWLVPRYEDMSGQDSRIVNPGHEIVGSGKSPMDIHPLLRE